jgi:hypothetical protein
VLQYDGTNEMVKKECKYSPISMAPINTVKSKKSPKLKTGPMKIPVY